MSSQQNSRSGFNQVDILSNTPTICVTIPSANRLSSWMLQSIGSVTSHGVPQTNWHKTLVSALGVADKRRLWLKRKS